MRCRVTVRRPIPPTPESARRGHGPPLCQAATRRSLAPRRRLSPGPRAASSLNPDGDAVRRAEALKLEVDTSTPTVAKVTLSVPSDEFQREVQQGLGRVSRNVRMKGFRPGKVPAKFLEKQFGDDVRNEVKERFVQQAYGQAVEEHSLRPIAHPRLGPEDLALQEDGSFDLEFEVPLKPQIELPEYKGLEITSELEPVMDEQVDAALEEIRKGQSTPTAAGDDGIDAEGFVVAKIRFMVGDEEVMERDGIRLGPKAPVQGVDAEAFEEALVGAKDGDTIELAMTIPEFVENEEARGKDGMCVIEVTNAMNLVPPTDEELVSLFGEEVTDIDSLRAFVRTRLEEQATQREEQRQESDLLDRVLSSIETDLPAPMIEQQTEARLSQLTEQMKQQGASEEDLEKARTEGRADAEQDARKGLKALLVVEQLGETEGLLVSGDDVEAELRNIAARNQAELDEVREYYSQNNLGQQLAIEILEKKVRRFLRENADVKDPS